MKKLVLILIALFAINCENPSIERGLASLEESLAQLEASFLLLDVEKMQSDLLDMNETVAQMVIDQEEANEAAAQLLLDIESILASLAEVQVLIDNAVTTEQVAALAAQFADINTKIQTLVAIADYDHDGVMNALDQCPDTPITEINNVNAVGCAPGETPTNNGG